MIGFIRDIEAGQKCKECNNDTFYVEFHNVIHVGPLPEKETVKP